MFREIAKRSSEKRNFLGKTLSSVSETLQIRCDNQISCTCVILLATVRLLQKSNRSLRLDPDQTRP